MAGSLTIQLFGGFQITQDGASVAGFANARLQSLVTYLILQRGAAQSRQHLASFFWPDSGESQARTNLRNILHLLRNTLPDFDRYISVDTTQVQWRVDAPAQVDLLTFERLLHESRQTSDAARKVESLTQALHAVRGDLLPDCLDEWILPWREEWQQRQASVKAELIDALELQRDYRRAIELAQQLLQHDPLQESTYARLMQLHAAQGDRATALRIYHTCVTTLQREIGVEPSPTTQAIYERLLNLEAGETPNNAIVTRLAAPLIGRERQWSALQTAWQNAKLGMPSLLVVNGEAGIGKTRLVEEMVEWVNRQGNATATAHCYVAGGRLAFAPIQQWLRTPALQRTLATLAPLWRKEIARLLPELLPPAVEANVITAPNSVVALSSTEAQTLTETAQRRRLFEALVQVIVGEARPLLLMLDDCQWCDADTLEWLDHLLHISTRLPLLVIATVRSGELTSEHPLTALLLRLERQERLHHVDLERLTLYETGQLIAKLTGHTPEDRQLAYIFHESEGNPLFVIETVRANQDRQLSTTISDDPPTPHSALRIPPSLSPKIQAVIESRLVRLSPDARRLVDAAAVIGGVFSTQLLAPITNADEDSLVQGLDELWQQQIIREHQLTTQNAELYDFTHDKLREVVYAALSPMRRRQLHRRIAQALEQLQETDFSADGKQWEGRRAASASLERLDALSAQIALHHERAGQVLEAVSWYRRAAQMAQRLSALQEGLAHLQHALVLTHTLPEGMAGALAELSLQMAIGSLLLATRGYAAPEVERAFERAWQLCQQVGDTEQSFRALWGLGRFYFVKPDPGKGLEVTQQLIALAEESGDPNLLIEAYAAAGTHFFHRAAHRKALDYFERSIALYDKTQHGQHGLIYGQDPCVVSLTYGAWTCWCLGDQARAQLQIEAALQLASELDHPYSQVIPLTYASVQYQFQGDAQRCLQQAEVASELANQHGFTLWLSMANFLRGWSQAQLGDSDGGLNLMYESAELFRSTGAELGSCYFAALLAETVGRAGQPEMGLIVMNEAFDSMERADDRWCEAELQRIRGTLLLLLADQQRADPELSAIQMADETYRSAQESFAAALRIAQAQAAGWWAIRATESLKKK